ncbi:MAG: cytochrome b N-terminal domain-containing protein [Thermodesulfovibrionales bacterium]
MLSRLMQWLEYRWPVSSVTRLMLDEEIPGGARFAYTLGSSLLIVFMLQAVTGLMQLLFYVSSTEYAYDSISYLRTKVAFGWLIHGMHYWGANIMVVLVTLHMARVFVWGAYKRPRELTWLAGVLLLMTVMAFSFTGAPLHWDQRGYWAGEVGTSIAGTTPVVGGMMKRFMRGGEEMGQLTLSRFFVAHVAVLPLALLAMFTVHIIAMRRFGTSGPWAASGPEAGPESGIISKPESKQLPKGPFWPDQVFKDAVTGTAVFILLVGLTVFLPPSYSGQADTLDTSFVPKPEWNFLFLYQALKYFQGSLEPIGTAGVPTVLILLLVLLPFIDRNPERNPFRRPVAMLCAAGLAGIIIWLSITGYLSTGFALPGSTGETKAAQSVRPETPPMRVSPIAAEAVAAETRLSAKTEVPRDAGHSGLSKISGLPGRAAYIIGSSETGATLFKKYCMPCHGQEGVSKLPNPGTLRGKVPDLNPIDRDLLGTEADASAKNIDRFIQHGAVPEGKAPAIKMPSFGDTHTLTQQQIANIEAYVLRLNSIDRAEMRNQGMQPRSFFLMLVSVYALLFLWFGGLWRKGRTS